MCGTESSREKWLEQVKTENGGKRRAMVQMGNTSVKQTHNSWI
jgi:hypothetical protein